MKIAKNKKKFLKPYLHFSILSSILLWNSSALAATNDNISAILQRELELQLKKSAPPPLPKVQKPIEQKKPVEGEQTVQIKNFLFSGNKLLTEQELQSVVEKWKNKSLTFDDLQNVIADIQEYYSSKNRIVKALLPEQEIKDGIISIKIVEGVLGDVVVEQKSQKPRMTAETVKKYFKGEKDSIYIDTKDLQRKIFILNDLPGVNAIGTYEQGKKEGESNFKVTVEDTPFFKGELAAANFGSKSTGSNQAIANVSFNNISGIGDLFSVNGIKSSGSDYVQGSYAVPILYDGLKLALNASKLDYQTLSSFSSTNQSRGDAKTYGANFTYPVYRTDRASVNAKVGYETKDYLNTNVLTAATISDYKIDNMIAGLNGFLYNNDQSSISYNTNVTFGRLKINDAAQETSDNTSAKTKGSFEKLAFNISRNQTLPDLKNTNWLISVDGQTANKNLNSSEQMSLGGPYAVRAYPTGQGSGSQGMIIKTELQYPYDKNFTFGPFLDVGFIKQYINTYTNWQGSTRAKNDYSLAATGITGTYKYNEFNVNGNLAYRIGDNPLHTSTGERLNADNDYKRVQAWIRASYNF
ncbi:MAG: ShlB/FhaC/HecB family hemolysin secretion/activation protein [Pelagibacterales bacterium]|nr:ShlB/FhaC/HecB family hemolysin secretion/activation protein [Pelagibacterales bacterium]